MFLHHEAEKTYKWLGEWQFDPVVVVPPLYFLVWVFARAFDADAVAAVFAVLVGLSPILLPFGLFILFWKRWMHYIRFNFWFSTPMVVLHIELPPEVTKSPAAMELVLTGLHNSGGETTFIARIWEGKFMLVSSLELVAEAGRVSYYLYTRRAFKQVAEARIYGQFPEARVTEVEDYASKLKFDPQRHDLWGTEYKKSDKSHAVPIKTYFDWELNLNPDTPETKIDPLTNLYEFFGTLGPGERVWVQIIIHAHKKDQWYGFYLKDSDKKFEKMANDKIKEITKEAITRTHELLSDKALGIKDLDAAKARSAERGGAQLTQGEGFFLGSVERGKGKLVFDCGIRALYIADKDKFNGTRIGQLVTLWAPFKSGQSRQGLGVTRGLSIFDYPWQDWRGMRARLIKKQLFFWYKHRAYFFGTPLDQNYIMMTTEELASLWHFPSSQVKTPALERVASRVSEAPLNLPVAQGPLNLPQ